MHLVDLFESPERDISRSGMVDKLRMAIYTHLYNIEQNHGADYRLPLTVEYKGQEHPALYIGSIQKYEQGIFSDVAVVFHQIEKGSWGGTGFAIPLSQPMHGINYAVFLDTRGETVLDCMRAVYGSDTSHVFRHEFQHILDMKRRKDQKFKPGKPDSSPSGYTSHDDDPTAYHNHPLERNAYWHNLAEPLLTNLRHSYSNEEEFLDTWELSLPDSVPDDFAEFLKVALLRAPPGTKAHMQRLSPENKRRAIARLYQLHQHYLKVRDRAVKGISKRWQDELEPK